MLTIIIEIKSMKKSPKQNWESNIRRTPIILGLSAALCMPSAFSYANASDTLLPVNWFSLSSKDVLLQVKS